jgi:molybdate transport system ATP-binding protein
MSALEADIAFHQGDFALHARFTAPGDGITVLFGPSGSGKSTLLSVLAGLKRPAGAHIVLGGRALQDLAPHRRGVGLVFQNARLFPHLTVRQNIAYAKTRAPRDARLDVEDAARFFDILTLLDRPVGNLSGGEKNRVALARALVSQPDFLLLDEPFAALDGTRRRAFVQGLLEMHRTYHLPMMVVTHNIDDAAALASHLVALKDGGVVAAGSFFEASATTAFRFLLDPRDFGSAVAARHLRNLHGDATQSLWLRADHVLLASEHPRAISARNVIAGKIAAAMPEPDGGVLIELKTDLGLILSRVTREAAEELNLIPGQPAWALIKAHAI